MTLNINNLSPVTEDQKELTIFTVWHRKNPEVNLYQGELRDQINDGTYEADLREFEWVAEIDETEELSLGDVFAYTNHGVKARAWQDHPAVTPRNSAVMSARSTMIGDIITGNDKAYIVDLTGLTEIETN